MSKNFICSISSLILGIFSLFHFSQVSEYMLVSYCHFICLRVNDIANFFMCLFNICNFLYSVCSRVLPIFLIELSYYK